MDVKYPLIAAAVSLALVSAAAHSLAIATDSCAASGERLCAAESPTPTDRRAAEPEAATLERTRGEQAPPEPMPVSRGMTYAMEQPEAYWPNHSAIFASMPQHQGAALF